MKNHLKMLGAVLLGLAVLVGAGYGTTLPSYSNTIFSRYGRPLQATITVYAAGTTTLSTIYSEATGTTAEDNPFTTDSLGRFTFYAATGLYDIKVSGSGITTYTLEDVTLGLYGEKVKLDHTNTSFVGASATDEYKMVDLLFSFAPSSSSTTGRPYAQFISAQVPESNTSSINQIYNTRHETLLYGSGTVTSTYNTVIATIAHTAPTSRLRGLYLPTTSYTANANLVEGEYNGIYHWSTSTSSASTPQARNAFFEIWNEAKFVDGVGPTVGPTITDARNVQVRLENGTWSTGSVGATVGTYSGIYAGLKNEANSTITTSRYFYLETPTNSGTLTNHYGFYLADQTVSGSTLNYAIYSAGSKTSAPVSFRPPVAMGLPTTAMTLENSQITFSVNEGTNTLTITVKYSDGTVKTATVILS